MLVTEGHVRHVTGMSGDQIDRAVANGNLPMPSRQDGAARLWTLGDLARLEMGWA